VSANASGCHQWTNKRGVNGSRENVIFPDTPTAFNFL